MDKMSSTRRPAAPAWAASLLAVALGSVCGGAQAAAVQATAEGNVLKLAAGETLQLAQTTRLAQLVLGEGASITAPEGYSLTLTVNGIGKPQKAKTYSGDIVLTVTEAIPVQFALGPTVSTYAFRTGLYFQDGALVPAKSVAAIVQAGSVSGPDVTGLVLSSQEEKFNGLMLGGTGTHRVSKPRIKLVGNGQNDFVGLGAAIRAVDNTTVRIDQARLSTQGAVRPAIFVGDNSVVTVSQSEIEALGGTLPADYVRGTILPGQMMEVPWVLGITGNNRATLATGSSQVTYKQSHIKAQAWGALSTDSVTKVRLSAVNSVIDVLESGYGAYADGSSLVSSAGSTFNVADMALILSNGAASGAFTKGSIVKSGRFGVMSHGVRTGTLSISDSSFDTQAAVIQAKSSTLKLSVSNATLRSASGLLLQAVVDDDPVGASFGYPTDGSALDATFQHSVLSGDIINGNTKAGTLNISLQASTLTGAITTASTVHATDAYGQVPTLDSVDLGYLIGEFIHTPATTGFGLNLTMDGAARWEVTKTSYLSGLTLAKGATLAAPAGKTLSVSVNGTPVQPKPGQAYSGVIVVAVN